MKFNATGWDKSIDKWVIILIQFLVPVAFGFYSIMLGQDTNWDLRNYHLYNPYAFLNGRLDLDLAPAGLQTYYNPSLDLAYFEMNRHLAPRALGFVLGFFQGLNFILLFNICRYCLRSVKIQSVQWAFALTFLGILSVGFLSEVGTTFWDNLVSLFPLASLLIILASLDAMITGRRGVFLVVALSGIIVGMGGGVKPLSILYSVSLLLSFFVISIPWKRKLTFALLFGGSVAVGLMATEGFWLLKIWHLMGNPIFPLMNNFFHADLAPFVSKIDEKCIPKNLFEKMFYPAIFTVDPMRVGDSGFKQINWLIVYLTSVFFIMRSAFYCLCKKEINPLKPEVKYLFSFFWFSFLIWLNISGRYRYLIPIEIMIPLVLFVLVLSIFELEKLTQVMVLLMLGFVTVFNLTGIPNHGRTSWADQAFRFETKWSRSDKIDSVIMIGQALAWIIPVLDIQKPFIQILPNFPVNEAYVKRAKSLIKDSRDGKILVVFDPKDISLPFAGNELKRYDLDLMKDSCTNEIGHIGTQVFDYRFCPAMRIRK